ncbi:TIGR03752 family integrating conjugative element protein [Vibrio hyugaensis]|uniref:TIGR03752 family integrating conjugative element protein n=1 Tax=Vibrio hyugaensis TaxID=1534743 RepID=UPI0005EF09F8|nr:TIGR03752 family integrating conjugative element protein [Vibrio hyugaensis]
MLTRGNPIIKIGGALGLAAFVAMLLTQLRPDSKPEHTVSQEEAVEAPVHASASEAQAKALQAFNDSPLDTIRTLGVAYQKSEAEKAQLAKALEQTQAQMAAQQSQNDKQVEALENQLSLLTERLNTSLSSIEEKVSQSRDEFRARQAPVRDSMSYEEELGLDSPRQGLPTGTGSGIGYAAPSPDGLIWTEPLDATQDKDGNWLTPATQAAGQALGSLSDEFGQQGRFDANQKQGTPVYTLHRGAMLANAVSMTALMGRIPMNGQVTDPYPFSMIVGRENLLANGFTLPDVQGAIVTGTVTGDWSLSCVRGVVESIDFIRADGSILSFPEDEEVIDSGFDGTSVKTGDLGFLADPNGNPCLTGERISNAPEYLTTQGLLDAASAAANAVAISQQTISVDGSTSTSAVTGNAAKNAAAESAAAFTGTVSEFIQARMGASFDIIYTPPGTKASIHLRKPVTLRAPVVPVRVRYDTPSQGASYALP